MAGPIIIVPKYAKLGQGFSEREKFDAAVHPGRRTKVNGYQSPASWIADRTDLRQFIILCSFCRVKFNHRKHGYREWYCPDSSGMTNPRLVNGQCDDCKEMTVNCGGGSGYVHETLYAKVCVDPIQARRAARARARALNPYLYIQKTRRENICKRQDI